MGSEGPPAVTVHVTGFKKFHGVAENPTETIVSNLQDYVKKKGTPKGLILGSCTVLDTAGQGAVGPLYQTLQSALPNDGSDSSNSRVIWVSLFPLTFPLFLTTWLQKERCNMGIHLSISLKKS